jgi:hypothetical protein
MTDKLTAKGTKRRHGPPKEHQFKKGVSGNPNGRPPKKPREAALDMPKGMPGLFDGEFKSYFRKELERDIVIKEGEKSEKLPTMQAIARSLNFHAAKGNFKAIQLVVGLITQDDADRAATKMELLGTAISYKEYWAAEFARRARTGETGPEPVPHPNDVIIHPTGEVTINGPVLLEQRHAMDALFAKFPDHVSNLRDIEERLTVDPTDKGLQEAKKKMTSIVDTTLREIGKRNMQKKIQEAIYANPSDASANSERAPTKRKPKIKSE